MHKGLVAILVALALVIIGFILMRQKAEAPVAAPDQTASTTQAARTFSWRFQVREEGVEDGLPPRSHVALITNGDVYDLGNYPGSCAEIAAENLLPGEAAGVLCWWAGGADEIGVFTDERGFVVKLGVQEEGTAETEGFRGDFQELIVLQ